MAFIAADQDHDVAELISTVLGDPEPLRGRFERLGESEQIARMRKISDALGKVAARVNRIPTRAALRAVMDHFEISESDANYGLLYGLRSGSLKMENNMLEPLDS